MTLNGIMAPTLRYFTKFVYDVVVKKLMFTTSSPNSEEYVYWRGYTLTIELPDKTTSGIVSNLACYHTTVFL